MRRGYAKGLCEGSMLSGRHTRHLRRHRLRQAHTSTGDSEAPDAHPSRYLSAVRFTQRHSHALGLGQAQSLPALRTRLEVWVGFECFAPEDSLIAACTNALAIQSAVSFTSRLLAPRMSFSSTLGPMP